MILKFSHFHGCLESVKWNSGMDYWNGIYTGIDWDKIFVVAYVNYIIYKSGWQLIIIIDELCQHSPWNSGLYNYVGLTYIAQSLIDIWHYGSKHDARDKLIQYSLWKGKDFHTHKSLYT